MTKGCVAPLGVKTLRLGSSSCTVMYQGVATRNGTTTREILAHWTEDQPNFALTEFSEVRMYRILGSSPQESFKTSPIGGMRQASQPFMLGGVVQRGGADHLAPLWWKEEYRWKEEMTSRRGRTSAPRRTWPSCPCTSPPTTSRW